MLTEFVNVRQQPGEPRRRWFQSAQEDLIVWYIDDAIVGFRFCYDRLGNERALTWKQGEGFSHRKVDSGVLQRFLSVSAALP